MAQVYEEEALKAPKTDLSYTAFLARLVEEKLAAKIDRSVHARVQMARLPMARAPEEFDFTFQTSLSPARLRRLAELGFVQRAENILLVGKLGVGKTHLSIAMALPACQARKRVRSLQAVDLLDDLLPGCRGLPHPGQGARSLGQTRPARRR